MGKRAQSQKEDAFPERMSDLVDVSENSQNSHSFERCSKSFVGLNAVNAQFTIDKAMLSGTPDGTIPPMFNFGKPKTAGDWIVHAIGAIIALFLVWWMLRAFVL